MSTAISPIAVPTLPERSLVALHLAVETQRDEYLLQIALTSFSEQQYADALVAVESVCRRHSQNYFAALFRARIADAVLPAFSSHAWFQAYCREPENPQLQDGLLQAWLAASQHLAVLQLGQHFLPERCRAGTEQSLLKILRAAGAGELGACWREQQQVVVCMFASQRKVINVMRADGHPIQHSQVNADGVQTVLTLAQDEELVCLTWQDDGGDAHQLSGSPLRLRDPVPFPKNPPQLANTGAPHPAAGICLIIPVYQGVDRVQQCLHSVLASRVDYALDLSILVVNDASPEAELSAYLHRLAQQGDITLLRNPFNLGYLETINRALQWHHAHYPHHDVMLLNADTLVHGDWLGRMQRCLHSDSDIASVTPWSNNGEISSFPRIAHPASCPSSEQLAALDQAAAQTSAKPVTLPSCCGFCMLMRYDIVRQVGLLDGYSLQRGYGEEVDWCLRASALGYRHLLLPQVFVAHAGGVSFGAEKTLRVKQNKKQLQRRYPHYYARYQEFLRLDPLRDARTALLEQLQMQPSSEAFEWWQFVQAGLQPTRRASHLPAALAGRWRRIAIWQFNLAVAGADKVLQLARAIASQNLPLRLCLFGEASEALWHSGVVEELRDNPAATFLSDTALLALLGCDHILLPAGQVLSSSIAQSELGPEFDVQDFLTRYSAQHGWSNSAAPIARRRKKAGLG